MYKAYVPVKCENWILALNFIHINYLVSSPKHAEIYVLKAYKAKKESALINNPQLSANKKLFAGCSTKT